jgi:hypothetical protein
MGVDLRLTRDGETVFVEMHTEGSTYLVGGSTEADIAITYNYSKTYRRAYEALELEYKGMCGMFENRVAGDCIPEFTAVVAYLGTEKSQNYWDDTPGNAGHALSVVLGWCRQHPDALIETWC